MSRRRFARSASKPDMGWLVGVSRIPLSGEFPGSNVDFLFDFVDIDPDAVAGRIEADKSDWFIKRCLMDFYATARLPGVDQDDYVRVLEVGISTVGVENATAVNANDHRVFGPEWYNLQSRIIQTFTMPAYHAGQIPQSIANPSNYTAIPIVDATTAANSDPVGFVNMAGWYGPGYRTLDISVSNAGLRNNQGFCVTASKFDLRGNEWQTGDDVWLDIMYRVLLQKRR